MNVKRILVPVDFSEFSKKALECASRWAERFDARMTLAHVVVLHAEEFDEAEELRKLESFAEEKERERARILHEHKKLLDHPEEMIDAELLRGFSAGDALLNFMIGSDFDLVVMGNHGYTGVKKWLYGSVAEKVVRFSSIPVLTVHKDFANTKIERILIPVDFSEHSKQAINTARALAGTFGARLEFLHVVELETLPTIEHIHVYPSVSRFDDMREHILKSLVGFVGMDVDSASFVVKDGSASKEIAEHAGEVRSDLIVMSVKGQGDLEHFLIGSNAERVVCTAPCPVLTVGRGVTSSP